MHNTRKLIKFNTFLQMQTARTNVPFVGEKG